MRHLLSFQRVAGAAALWAVSAGLACVRRSGPAAPPPGISDAATRTSNGRDAAPPRDAAGVPDGRAAVLGASFDCRKAATKSERLICASPALSRLDGEVAAAFKEALRGYQDPKVLRGVQRTWLLGTRNEATDEEQLQKAYTARLQELRDEIEAAQEVVRGELAWRMVTGKTTEIVMPVITRWRDAKAKERINAVLATAAAEMGCDGEPEEGAPPFDYWMRASVTYAEDDIFSVDIHSGWYCGGAYPTHDSNSSRTFDLRTGGEVQFAELFTNYARDRDKVLRAVFGEEVAKAEGDHVLTLPLIGEYPLAFSFHEDGLHVQPCFPHVIAALAEEATAPYVALKKFAARKGLLARITD